MNRRLIQKTLITFALFLMLGPFLPGCTGDGGMSYASVYEGVFGDEPPPSPSEAVTMMYNRADPDQRQKGIRWLSAASFGGEEEYVASYRLFVSDPEANVRAAAAKALGRHGTSDDAMLLSLLLKDEDALVRWQAADALRKIHNPRTVPDLVKLLDPDLEDDGDTRTAAAMALGQYPDRVVFSRLVGALVDRDFAVVNAAHHSLTQLTGHDAGLDPRDWAQWSESQTDLFANQKPYTYDGYQPTRGWFEYLTFWNNQDQSNQTPRGLSDAGGD